MATTPLLTASTVLTSNRFLRLGLPLAAVVITLLVAFREIAPPPPQADGVQLQMLAPLFELNDQHGKPIRLKSYLGRMRIVVVFFNGEKGGDRDPLVRKLIEHYPRLHAAGIQTFAISMATPYANREAEKRLGMEAPFPLLTDIDLVNPAPSATHRNWGRYDEARDATLTGLFLIDRRGYVATSESGRPAPQADPERAVDELIQGLWPGQ